MPVTSNSEEETPAEAAEPVSAAEETMEPVMPASSVPDVSYSDAEPDREPILDRR